jgi:PPOX class probable F420-dependent enzyme
MTALTPVLEQFLDEHVVGVLATRPRDGNPRQSVVYYVRDGERLLISSVAGRVKVRDVERSEWASLCVMAPRHPFASATFSGRAEILTTGIGPATAAVAQRFMQADEPPEQQSDAALAAVGRVIIAISIERAAAVSHLEQ